MTSTRLTICAATWTLLTAAAAAAEPAYVPSTLNLRTAAGTNNEVVAKIPGGSLVQVVGCIDGWCEVDWQGRKGFSIATGLDRSGRVPSTRPAARIASGAPVPAGPGPVVVDGPPIVVGGPLYYPYRPYAYPYYGSGPYWGYRRWRRW